MYMSNISVSLTFYHTSFQYSKNGCEAGVLIKTNFDWNLGLHLKQDNPTSTYQKRLGISLDQHQEAYNHPCVTL